MTFPKVLNDYIELYVQMVVPYYKDRLEKLLTIKKYYLLSVARAEGFTAFEYEMQYHRHELDDWLEKHVRKNAETFCKKLMNRVEKKCGNIVNVDDLHLNGSELNGIVIGDKGTANVYTVLAGGYNVQCLHQRVLVK